MNVLTVPVARTATNVIPESPWPREPVFRIERGSAAQTALSSYDFEWTELPMNEAVYYCTAGVNDVESTNLSTWVVQRIFTPPTESHFRNRILQARLPAKWILEGVQPPTTECRAKAYEIWQRLYTKFGLLPVRVSASVEGGITLCYEHATNSKRLIVETYNDLEVAALVNDSNRIVSSENIKALDFDCAFLEFNV
jgi:hypothetical protein